MLFCINQAKATEALLFVCNKLEVPDKHKISKILYYADKTHLEKYGRLITGDRYVKMDYGPVPSWIYDLIKKNDTEPEIVEVKGYSLKPLRRENIDEMSESDIECLQEAIKGYADKSFQELVNESHDETWHAGTENKPFTDDEFLLTLPNREEIAEFIKEDC